MSNYDELITELATRKMGRENLLDFCTYTMPEYEVNWHHRLIASSIDRMLLPIDVILTFSVLAVLNTIGIVDAFPITNDVG